MMRPLWRWTICRCPASRLSEFLNAGVTTVVGLLGTDAVSRSNEELIIKVNYD